ncbi:restriction endonuclease subunit S [Gaetbulibacter sp. PBL-D1]|uniref:restriction endonuclease subunit S n=1 Tax=Gaetbulibacter sp. PBL-D1 TaxID=3422594 RepID=UPI003D2EE42D
MPSIANTIGTNMKNYKIIRKNQFAYGPVTSRNGDKISIALLEEHNEAIVSQAYTVFEVVDDDKLLPEYLMMWFRRPEFDRYARFKSHGSARETFDWDELCEVTLPIPSIEKQQQIVAEYNTVTYRIELNEKINTNLEATAQALYKHWFVDFEFPIDLCQSELVEDPNCHLEHVTSSTSPRAQSRGEKREVSLETLNKIDFTKGYKSSGGKMVYNEELDKEIPEGWSVERLEDAVKIIRGASPRPIADYISNKGAPWVKISDATACSNQFLYKTKQFIKEIGVSKSRVVLPETLILSNSASPGLPRIMKIKACVHDGWLIFNDYKNITREYLLQFLIANKRDILSNSNGSVFKNLKTEILKEFPIIISNKNILNLYTTNQKIIDDKLERISTELLSLKELQSLLLAKMTQVTKTVDINI